MSKIVKAFEYAAEKHKNQTRKNKGSIEPYINHPIRVADRVAELFQYVLESRQGKLNDYICIAIIHDVVEDCGVKIEEIDSLFGEFVAHGVHYLTDFWTSERLPGLNRKARKKAEANRLTETKNELLFTIKLLDIEDNLLSYEKSDSFLPTFIQEVEFLLECARENNLYPTFYGFSVEDNIRELKED